MPYCHHCTISTNSIEYSGTPYCTRCEEPVLLPQIEDGAAWALFVKKDSELIMFRVCRLLESYLLRPVRQKHAEELSDVPRHPLTSFSKLTVDTLAGESPNEYGCIGCGCSATAVILLMSMVATLLSSAYNLSDEAAFQAVLFMVAVVFILVVIGALIARENNQRGEAIRGELIAERTEWLQKACAVRVTPENYPEIKKLEIILSGEHSAIHAGHWVEKELAEAGITIDRMFQGAYLYYAGWKLGIGPPPLQHDDDDDEE